MTASALSLAEDRPSDAPTVPLFSVAGYADSRIDGATLTAATFVGVDNLLADRQGRGEATFGANTDRVTEYLPGDVLVGNIRPYLKKIWLADRRGGCSGDVLAIRLKDSARETVLPEYLFYVLSSDSFFAYNMKHARGAKMPRGDKDAILQFLVPVPPVDVQRTTVAALDELAGLFPRLEEQLEAERVARRKQYESAAQLLLESGADVGRRKFGDVATIARGGSPRPIQSFFCTADEGVPWIKIGDVPAAGKYITRTSQHITAAGASKSRRVRHGDFVLSNSMSFGRPYISKIDGYIHDGWLAISEFGSAFLPDYLYYLLRSSGVQDEFRRRAGSGTVKNLNADIVRSIELPVPTLERQAQVVKTLDPLSDLTNDLVTALVRESDLRRKQFSFLRDELLGFTAGAGSVT